MNRTWKFLGKTGSAVLALLLCLQMSLVTFADTYDSTQLQQGMHVQSDDGLTFNEQTIRASLTALWGVRVIFEDYDHTELASDVLPESGSTKAPADPSRQGYVFKGWERTDTTQGSASLQEDGTVTGIQGPGPIVFTAVYEEIPETETTETPAPETEAPETEPQKTPAPETEAPETEPQKTPTPETEAPETEPQKTPAPEKEDPGQKKPEPAPQKPEAPSQGAASQDSSSAGTSAPQAVRTGDSTPLGLWLTVLAGSLLVAVAAVVFRKRYCRSGHRRR